MNRPLFWWIEHQQHIVEQHGKDSQQYKDTLGGFIYCRTCKTAKDEGAYWDDSDQRVDPECDSCILNGTNPVT